MGKQGRRQVGYTPPPTEMTAWQRQMDRLFVRTTEDLWQRSGEDERDWYESLQIAGLLRALLIDGNPLLSIANRAHRVGFSFSARPMHYTQRDFVPPDRTTPTGWGWHGACLDPEIACGQSDPPIKLTRDGWLKHQVAMAAGRPVTMHEYVLAVANTMGAVHRDPPANPFEGHMIAIMMATESAPIVNAQAALLRAIGRVTAAGLKPLADRVANGQPVI